TGESGGVSILGLFASLLGGIIIGAIYLIANFNISNFILITLMGLIGSIFDSVLGIILEAKYECLVCGKIVEYNRHCNKATRLIHGKTFIDNNTVNLLNNIFIFVLSYILLY
ncbi:MAG: DUF92 domain-containing protein, partial [Bacilli bacterium]|nr:DUF92 domain-containing protein [Bacilli bacterium]